MTADSEGAAPARRGPGNHIAEWFGHRVFPTVSGGDAGLANQKNSSCPFLSDITGAESACVKDENSKGVCTVSSRSNGGQRQDWPVCPIRALDDSMLDDAVRRLFGYGELDAVEVVQVTSLALPGRRAEVKQRVLDGEHVVAYFQTKLGGEIRLAATERSPEFNFDSTMVELLPNGAGGVDLGRYAIFEIQTMDYHGTYKHAVKNLRDGLRLHALDFHETLARRPDWVSDHMEGPNLSNVFKRTFYQMMFKFQVGAHEHSAGCVFAIPRPVWQSWQRHLGAPELLPAADGTWRFPGTSPATDVNPPAWIYVFDVNAGSVVSPNELTLWRVIGTDAATMSRFALEEAPNAALAEGGSVDRLMMTIRTRMAKWMPEILDAGPTLL